MNSKLSHPKQVTRYSSAFFKEKAELAKEFPEVENKKPVIKASIVKSKKLK